MGVFIFSALFHDNKESETFSWRWEPAQVRGPGRSPGCCVASRTALLPGPQPFWGWLPVKRKADVSFWVKIVSHDHIPIPPATLCQGTALKAVVWKTPEWREIGNSSLVTSTRHGVGRWAPLVLQDKTRHSPVCHRHDGTLHSYVYCGTQLRGHLLDDVIQSMLWSPKMCLFCI